MSVAEQRRLARMRPAPRVALDANTAAAWIAAATVTIEADPTFRGLLDSGNAQPGAAGRLAASHFARSERSWILDGAPRFPNADALAASVLRQTHRIAATLAADGL